MAHIVVMGAGTGGMPCAYELRMELGREHEITVINEREYFQFVPSNPWLAVGWRERSHITFDIRPHLDSLLCAVSPISQGRVAPVPFRRYVSLFKEHNSP